MLCEWEATLNSEITTLKVRLTQIRELSLAVEIDTDYEIGKGLNFMTEINLGEYRSKITVPLYTKIKVDTKLRITIDESPKLLAGLEAGTR